MDTDPQGGDDMQLGSGDEAEYGVVEPSELVSPVQVQQEVLTDINSVGSMMPGPKERSSSDGGIQTVLRSIDREATEQRVFDEHRSRTSRRHPRSDACFQIDFLLVIGSAPPGPAALAATHEKSWSPPCDWRRPTCAGPELSRATRPRMSIADIP